MLKCKSTNRINPSSSYSEIFMKYQEHCSLMKETITAVTYQKLILYTTVVITDGQVTFPREWRSPKMSKGNVFYLGFRFSRQGLWSFLAFIIYRSVFRRKFIGVLEIRTAISKARYEIWAKLKMESVHCSESCLRFYRDTLRYILCQ
jgi:hypothetical protein